VEQRLGVVDRLAQAAANLDLGGETLVRGQNVDLGPGDVRVERAHGLRHLSREDNSAAGRIGRVDLEEARRRIREHQSLNAFISLSGENGDGAGVAVKDLVDVAGMVTTGGGMSLPPGPAKGDAPAGKNVRAGGGVSAGDH